MPSLLIHPQVFQFIARGADLMLPGVLLPSGGLHLLQNSRMAVVLSDSDIPVAVGRVPLTTDITSRTEMSGKGLQITHFFGDALWKSGSRTVTADFSLDRLSNCEQLLDEHEIAAMEESQLNLASEPTQALEGNPVASSSSCGPTSTGEDVKIVANEVGVVTAQEETNDNEENVQEEDITEAEMDNLVTSSFLQALKRRLKDKDLPILASRFWAEFCIPCRPRGSELNLKRTSWKKLLPFLESQARDGVICINTTEQGVTSLVAIVRDHPRLEAFRTLPVQQTAEADLEIDEKDVADPSKPVIQEYWTLNKKLEFLFIVLEKSKDEDPASSSTESLDVLRAHLQSSDRTNFFSKAQLNTMLRDYLQLRELNHPTDPKLVKLDLNLCNALYPGGKAQSGDAVTKKDLMDAFSRKLIPIQMVTVNGEVRVEKGSQVGSIKIVVESRGGSKIVSRIQGLHHFGLDIKEVSKRASKKFASSAGQGSDDAGHPEILLQGNLDKSGPAWLQQEFHIPSKHISVDVKGNVKKKH